MSSLVQNLCVYGDSEQSFCIAIVSPIVKELEAVAVTLGLNPNNLEALCQSNPSLIPFSI